ncbi:hypothetical protein BJ684DRAFT_10350 [Piptocephalis cylindrospora]|uniref:R3H domain-containing protein n=1 Tax=Piptocephalis cylindrospora TaxID=1907219 RepID=A0A4P9Y3M9_9FUNG|nr:hypothetical protein BJ684DRAFT_10350 [Piptocephalis cylindrospora]|eukprot:RKP13252.1 hypothetical protein BJ684DRAFT_10350 [Piptocephalis cylindrospora]
MERKIRQFVLDGTLHSIVLNPMPPNHRAIIHQLARAFSLKSKSQGKDNERHTVLTRTPDTQYRYFRIESCMRRVTRQNPKMLWHADGKRGGKNKGKGRGGSGSAPEKPLKVVGEDAPAVQSSNIGHRMLEKMG